MIRRRQRAQSFVVAAFAMTTMLGALSMVVDAGIFFVVQKQLQNAADAAVLAAVWYAPACDDTNWPACQKSISPTAPECQIPPNDAFDDRPCTAAVNTTKANWSVALSLCQGPNLPTGTIPVKVEAHPGVPPAGHLFVPNVTPYVVTLTCDAPHWFGRVLPNVNLTMHISTSASAALGWLGTDGQLLGGATQPPGAAVPPRFVARLLI